MPVPKRRKSKSRAKKGKNAHYKRTEKQIMQTKDKKGYKTPHVDEYIEV
jgi:ribosomal protein L32